MNKLRRWSLRPSGPFALPLAADSRLHPTDYRDDQVWKLNPGVPDSPALTLQTNYGGRVGLATLIPLWTADGRLIYETQAYNKPPVITGFAPGYLRLQATLLPLLKLQAEYLAVDSHTVRARFTLSSTHTEPIKLRLDLFGHLGAEGKEQPLHIIPLEDGTHGLQLGQAGNLRPVVLLQGGQAELLDGQAQSPRIGRDIVIAARKTVSLQWVHAGLPSIQESLAQAQRWLTADWTPQLRQIVQAAQSIPAIETGDEDLDFMLAAASHQLISAFLRPTSSLPQASFVAQRDPGTGYGRDESSFDRAWSGQSPTLSYLAGLGIASIDARLAQGIVQNYLAIQQDDGWIDARPGLGGQRQGLLCMPVLARLAWGIFQYTEDSAFLRESFPGLLRFFERWLQADVDQDGLPEWQSEDQTGFRYWPGFASLQAWSDNTAVRYVESPDLMAYLLSEAVSLRAMAHYLKDARHKMLDAHVDRLSAALAELWDEQQGRYSYRDRDTHLTQARRILLEEAAGDGEHILAMPINPPSRLNMLIEGGVSHTPRLTLHIKGLDAAGETIDQAVDVKAFSWQHNRGVYSSEQVFSQLDLLRLDGLSRVYTVTVSTPDTTHLDINALLPLWSVAAPAEHLTKLIDLLTNPDHFWRSSGVTMVSAQDPAFDPANENGAGGVWPYWLTLMGEGLIEAGREHLAAELLQKLLKVQLDAFRAHEHFFEFYHSDRSEGLGTPGQMGGIVPLHLLLRVLGIRIISAAKVWTGGAFHWLGPVTIRQHGVTITRSQEGTAIQFPSGYEIELPAAADWQEVIDPQPKAISTGSQKNADE